MESRVSTLLKRSTSETWSVCDRASVRTMKSKSAAVKRAREFALIIGNSSYNDGGAYGKSDCRLPPGAIETGIVAWCSTQAPEPAGLIAQSGEVARRLLYT